jgi:hypothetical protein
MQGRIKRGAGIFQDRNFCKWPNCCAHTVRPNTGTGASLSETAPGLSWWGRTLSVVAYRNLKFTPPSKPTLFHYFTRKSCIGKMQRVAPTTQVVKPLFSINDP